MAESFSVRIYEFYDERSPTSQHPNIHVFSAGRCKTVLYDGTNNQWVTGNSYGHWTMGIEYWAPDTRVMALHSMITRRTIKKHWKFARVWILFYSATKMTMTIKLANVRKMSLNISVNNGQRVIGNGWCSINNSMVMIIRIGLYCYLLISCIYQHLGRWPPPLSCWFFCLSLITMASDSLSENTCYNDLNKQVIKQRGKKLIPTCKFQNKLLIGFKLIVNVKKVM